MLRKYPILVLPARNGALGGMLGVALLVCLFLLNKHPFFIPVIMDFRIILFSVLIFFTLREYRGYYQKGWMSFWEGMILSLVLTIAFAVTASLLIWIFGELQPTFVAGYIELKRAQLKLYPEADIKIIGKGQYDLYISQLPGTKPIDLAIIYFQQSFILSFFISVILSVILRRQPKIQ